MPQNCFRTLVGIKIHNQGDRADLRRFQYHKGVDIRTTITLISAFVLFFYAIR